MISPDQIQGTIDKVFFINDTSFILAISFKATTRLELWQFKDSNDQKPVFVRELTEIYEYYKDLPMTHFIDENSSQPFGIPYDCHNTNLNDYLVLQDFQVTSSAMDNFDLLILQKGNIKKSLKQKQIQFVLIDTSFQEYKYYKYFLYPNKNQTPALMYSQILNKNDYNQKYLGKIFCTPYCRYYQFQQISGKKNYFIAVINSSKEYREVTYEFIHILKLFEPNDQEMYFKSVKAIPFTNDNYFYNAILHTKTNRSQLRVVDIRNPNDDPIWYCLYIDHMPLDIINVEKQIWKKMEQFPFYKGLFSDNGINCNKFFQTANKHVEAFINSLVQVNLKNQEYSMINKFLKIEGNVVNLSIIENKNNRSYNYQEMEAGTLNLYVLDNNQLMLQKIQIS
eukprot:403351175